MNIIKHKNIFFAISLLVIVPGIISLLLFGLKLSIDFTGGSEMVFLYQKTPNLLEIKQVMISQNQPVYALIPQGNQVSLRTNTLTDAKHTAIVQQLFTKTGNFQETSFTTIGPTIGNETTINALLGVGLASILIILYVAWSFRKVPKPASSWRFGLCAVLALLHDVLVLLGIFSLLGHFFGIEVDSLFITAVLTVIGFSVHDTIVVFDRIRENLQKTSGNSFANVVNMSINQTMTRSLNTSLTVILVLFALFLFGGQSTMWFIVALLIGIISGTYSSIFNAAPLLVLWEEVLGKRNEK